LFHRINLPKISLNINFKRSGQSLFETSIAHEDMHNTTYQATETWTLSPDSKALTVDRVIANDGDGGHDTSKAVYHRE
jgi:hypothetical protein